MDRGWFHSCLVSGSGSGDEVLLEQEQLNFSFRNKFIILLPCGLLVDNNTFFFKCAFLEVLLAYTKDRCLLEGFQVSPAHPPDKETNVEEQEYKDLLEWYGQFKTELLGK
jgi:hypothetical protein